MQPVPDSIFQDFTLTQQEYSAAISFSAEQRQLFKNDLIDKIKARVALVIDPNNVNDFIQQDAYLKGQIELLEYQLSLNNFASQPSAVNSQE